MKVLIIHPEDKTTDFLIPSYMNDVFISMTKSGYLEIINDPLTPNKDVTEAIKKADVVIMMGHGIPSGLIAKNRLIVNSSHVYLLKEKQCIGIWCNANQFFSRYQLNGYSTGMVVSEDQEAHYFVHKEWTSLDVIEANTDLTNALSSALTSLVISGTETFRTALLESFDAGENPVKQYNLTNF